MLWRTVDRSHNHNFNDDTELLHNSGAGNLLLLKMGGGDVMGEGGRREAGGQMIHLYVTVLSTWLFYLDFDELIHAC